MSALVDGTLYAEVVLPPEELAHIALFDRLRAAQERELMLTIMEIDGVEAVRVHIAKAERSVFVREDVDPSASIMVRMARGRQLEDSQVTAIANLVAGSVPGMGTDAVKVVDQAALEEDEEAVGGSWHGGGGRRRVGRGGRGARLQRGRGDVAR